MTRFLVADIYQITGIGTVVVGQVTEGTLSRNMKVSLEGKSLEIKSLESNHKQVSEVGQGQKVGIALRFSSSGDMGLLQKLFSNSSQERTLLRKYVGKIIEFY